MKIYLKILLVNFIMLCNSLVLSQVGIGTTDPHASAMLEVTSDEKGFLPPRMTQLQRDAIAPVEGLVIYNLDIHCMEYWNNIRWISSCNADPAITSLDCLESITGVFTDNIYGSINKTISYTGGNGAPYGGFVFNSTGVEGLILSTPAGNLANGSGSIVFTLSGKPIGSGTAVFDISMGGQNCQFTVEVASVSLEYWVDETIVNNEKSVYIYNPSGLPVTADFHITVPVASYPLPICPLLFQDVAGVRRVIIGSFMGHHRLGTLIIPASGNLRISVKISPAATSLQWTPASNTKIFNVRLYKTNIGVAVPVSSDIVQLQGNDLLTGYYN